MYCLRVCNHRGVDKLPRIRLNGDLEGDYVVLAQRGNGSLLIAPVPRGGAPVVVALEQTCSACPAQWEGKLEDGRALYARYRGGLLRVGIGEDVKAAHTNSFPKTALYCEHIGDGLDGSMTFKELKGHLQGLLEFPSGLVVEGKREWGTEKIGVGWPDELRGSREDDSGSGDAPPRSET